MITTEYSVATPHGVFMAQWDEDEESPVKYSGDDGAISYFKAYLDLNSISGPGGALVRFDALEPADLYGFCQSEKYGIFVAPTPDDIMDDMEQEHEGQKMITVLDAVSDAKAFELIGEGAQILSRLNEDSETFFADIGTLREIIQQLGDDAPEQIIAAALTGTELGDFPDTPEGRVALRSAAKDYFAKLQGTKVFNASLNADIGFAREGIKKALSFSADPRKLKLIPALPKILASAVDAKKLALRGDDPRVVAMHVLKADVVVGDATLTVRVVVKERDDGSFFYDHSVNKGDLGGSTEVLDSVDSTGLSLIALLCTEPSMQQVLMDSVSQSGEVFNLFIEGEALEELTAEAAPQPEQYDVSMQTLISIAANSIAELRRIDVYRVLNSAGNQREALANFIIANRPDLQKEVLDVMAEEWPELGYSAPAAPAVAGGGNAELEAAGFKNVSGNEWAKGVQGESGKLNLNIRVFGTPEQFKLKKSASFTGGISGSPSQEVGTYNTAAEVVAAAQAEAAAYAPAAELLTPSEDGQPKQLEVPPVPEAGKAPEATPQRAADITFLSAVIAHQVDMWADDLADKIEALGGTYAGDAEVEKLWGDAINAYTDFMSAEMSKG